MITINEAQLSDIIAIKHVLSVTWRDTYLPLLSESTIKMVASSWHSPEKLKCEIELASAYMGVARSNDDVIGMITAHVDGQMLFVSRLYVLPSYQRNGIGRKLLEASYSAFPETSLARLEVEDQNSVGKEFYRKLGFSEISRTEDDVFGTVLNSITMECEIERSAP